MKCKFCGCTDEKACAIAIDVAGQITNAAPGSYNVAYRPCEWIAENICSAPACVDKAYAEAELLSSQLQFFMNSADVSQVARRDKLLEDIFEILHPQLIEAVALTVDQHRALQAAIANFTVDLLGESSQQRRSITLGIG